MAHAVIDFMSGGGGRAATPDSPGNRTGPFGVVITWLEKDWTG